MHRNGGHQGPLPSVYDDQPFDRQIVIPAVAFSGAKNMRKHTDIYSSCRLIVRKNGAEIYNR
ncbi:host specificity J domain protein, partial [Escherichia coli EC1845]